MSQSYDIMTLQYKMEHVFKKHMSHYKFIDYFKQSPAKIDVSCQKPSNRKSATKHKSDKLYTQISSSSRPTNKISSSTHQSPGKHKQEKLFKTSVLNYLHKCRSEYEENSTNLTQPKSSKNLRSINMVGQQQKTIKCGCSHNFNQNQIIQRTSQLLDIYKNRCIDLQQQKQRYKWQMQQANTRIKHLQKSIKKCKQQRKTSQKDK